MAKTKTTKTTTSKNNEHVYKGVIVLMAIAMAGLGAGLVYCATQMITGEEREYLELSEYLMKRFPQQACDSNILGNVRSDDEEIAEKFENRYFICDYTGRGISKDGDPYVEYDLKVSDITKHEQIGETQKATVYFQHQNRADSWGYSEAFTYK